MKLDPKLLKKVNQGQLIQAATLIGIKNPMKVSKEALVSAFVKKVEDVTESLGSEEAVEKWATENDKISDVYNNIIEVLGLKETDPGEGEPDSLPETDVKPAKPDKKGKGKAKKEKPVSKVEDLKAKKAAAKEGVEKAKKEKKEAAPRYSKFNAIGDTMKEMVKKGGKIEDFCASCFEKHVKADPTSKESRMNFYAKGFLKALKIAGLVEITDGTFKIIK